MAIDSRCSLQSSQCAYLLTNAVIKVEKISNRITEKLLLSRALGPSDVMKHKEILHADEQHVKWNFTEDKL